MNSCYFLKILRDLNLAVVKYTIVYVNKLVLQPELPLLCEPGLEEAKYMYCTYMNYRYIMQ
jgi:hypothetical protein